MIEVPNLWEIVLNLFTTNWQLGLILVGAFAFRLFIEIDKANKRKKRRYRRY